MSTLQPYSPIEFAHSCIQRHIKPNSICIDATCGNGYDTEFLLSLVHGEHSRVIGFDIQPEALERTRRKCEVHPNAQYLTLLNYSHDNLYSALHDLGINSLQIMIMNCGYLPNYEKSVITTATTTTSAVQQAVSMLSNDGCIAIVLYRGHDGASEEADAVIDVATQLPTAEFTCTHYRPLGRRNSPECVVIVRRDNAVLSEKRSSVGTNTTP